MRKLSKSSIVEILQKELDRLDIIIDKATEFIQNAPKGTLVVKKHGKGVQFYIRSEPQDIHGKYIRVSEKKTVQALAQKQYCRKILRAAQKQRKCIRAFLRVYDPEALERVFTLLGDVRKTLVKPFAVSDDLFAQFWESKEYVPKGFAEGSPEHYTQKGERVRSKSEVLIANALFQAGVPYRYECPLQLGRQVIYPDFTVLNVRERKEYYMEHLGMLDDTEYRNNAITRIQEYERNGIFLGDKLILTAETYKTPLNLQTVKRLIQHYYIQLESSSE